MDIFLYYFNTAFPYNRVKSKELNYKRWLSNGLLVRSKRKKDNDRYVLEATDKTIAMWQITNR
jgi:hypothetical protein